MVIGNLECEYALGRFLGYALLVSGERAFKVETLTKEMDVFNTHGYFVEANMNRHIFYKHKVKRALLEDLGQLMKYKKFGILGVVSDLSLVA